MDDETRRYVEKWEKERDRADRSANTYRNLRLGALTFTILAVGALLAFGWNAGFQYLFECTTPYQKLLRILIMLLLGITGFVYLPLEREFERRYRLSWQEGRFYETALGDFDGLHSKIQGIVHIQKPGTLFGRIIPRYFISHQLNKFSTFIYPTRSSLRRVVLFLAFTHIGILGLLGTIEVKNWYLYFTYPKVCQEQVVHKLRYIWHSLEKQGVCKYSEYHTG